MEHPEPIQSSMIYVPNYKLNGEDSDEWQCEARFSLAIQDLWNIVIERSNYI
jgi:nucleoside-specific outer membrane channel protein Tsx